MPVNRNVVVPVKDSQALSAMELSLRNSTVPTFEKGVGLQHSLVPLRQLLKQATYGEQTPKVVAAAIEAVAKEAFLKEVRLGTHSHSSTGEL